VTPRWVVYDEPAGGGGGGGPWDPSQLASLLSWYDADAETVADGTLITSLVDRAGSHDMSGSATLKTGVLNGKSVYRYNGTSDGHSIGANNILDAASGFWLFSTFSTDTPSAIQALYAYRDPNGQYPRPYFELRNAKLRIIAQRAPNDFAVLSNSTVTSGVPVVGGMFCDGTDQKLRRDGATVGSTAFAGGTLNAGQSLGTAIGYDVRSNILYFDGDIAEIVIGSANIQAADAEKIEGYLAHKWGLAGNLPVSHPYKNAAP